MTIVAHGPYEHVGAYADLAESEVFDTSGVPYSFCPDCEHDPCVAETGLRFPQPGACGGTPRGIEIARLTGEIRDVGLGLQDPGKAVYKAMVPAVYQLAAIAMYSTDQVDKQHSLIRLFDVLQNLRKLVAS